MSKESKIGAEGAYVISFGRFAGKSVTWIARYHPGYFYWLIRAAQKPATAGFLKKFAQTPAGKRALARGIVQNRNRTWKSL